MRSIELRQTSLLFQHSRYESVEIRAMGEMKSFMKTSHTGRQWISLSIDINLLCKRLIENGNYFFIICNTIGKKQIFLGSTMAV